MSQIRVLYTFCRRFDGLHIIDEDSTRKLKIGSSSSDEELEGTEVNPANYVLRPDSRRFDGEIE